MWKASFAKGSKIKTAEWQEIHDAIEWFATANRCSTDNVNCVHYNGYYTSDYTSDYSTDDITYHGDSHNGQSHNGSGHNSSHFYSNYLGDYQVYETNDSVLCPGGQGIWA